MSLADPIARQPKQRLLAFAAALAARSRTEMFWVAIGQISVVLGGILSLKLLAGYLGVEGFGRFVIGMTVAGTIGMLIYGPISQTAIRYWSIAQNRGQLRMYSSALAGGYLFSVACCAICIGVGAVVLDILELHSWLGIFVLCVLFSAMSGAGTTISAVLNATRRRPLLAAHQAAEALLRPLFIFAGMRWVGANASTAAAAYCITTALVTASMFLWSTRIIGPEITETPVADRAEAFRKLTVEMLKYSWPFALFGILGAVGVYGDKWLLKQWFGSAEVGKYAAMYQIASWPTIFLLGVLNQFAFPVLFSRAGDLNAPSEPTLQARRVYRLHLFGSIGIVALVCLMTYLFGNLALRVLTTAAFLGEHDALWIFVLGVALFNIAQQLTVKGMYLNRPEIYILPKTLQSLAFLLFAFIIGREHGLIGVAVAYGLSSTIYAFAVVLANRALPTTNR